MEFQIGHLAYSFIVLHFNFIFQNKPPDKKAAVKYPIKTNAIAEIVITKDLINKSKNSLCFFSVILPLPIKQDIVNYILNKSLYFIPKGCVRLNNCAKYKFKKFKKAKILYEYALIFNTSDDMIEYVCAANLRSIKKSSLYTEGGAYQLIITSYRNISKNQKCGVFFDKPHIDQIKQNSQLICDDNAILKLQKAFKAT